MNKLLQNEIPSYIKIFSFANLLGAWQDFKKRKHKKKDVAEFASDLIHNLSVLENDLLSRNYKHGGDFHFKISDPKQRDIHKAGVRDRVVHHAIYRALYPYFDRKFIHDSYSCRVEKGTHKALYRFESFIRKVSKNNTQTCWVLKCDIKKFFANIDHQVLKEIMSRSNLDMDTLWLLGQVIDSFYSKMLINSAIAEKINKGLPLGNLTSQLIVNVYMNEFDQFMKRELKVKYYIRYADDFVIIHHDKTELINLLPKINTYLNSYLNIYLHPDKVFIKTIASGVDFLGWVHFSKHRVLRTSTKRRMLKRLKERLKENSTEESKQSYLGMLKHGNSYKLKTMIQ